MTVEQVKKWLSRGRCLDEEINTLISEQERAFYSACGMTDTETGERVQTSRRNTSEERFISYADYSKMIDARIDELYRVKKEIMEAVNKINDSVLRTVLIKRYICFLTWEEIAVQMHYSYMHICRLHGVALKKIAGIIDWV